MIISDLNYMEAIETDVQGAGNVKFNTDVFKDVDIKVDVKVDIFKDVDSKTDIKGNLATAEASADALGYDTLSETESFAQVIENELSQSFSSSIAAA